MDNNLTKVKNDESGVLTAQLDAIEVTTMHLDPVPQYAPGVLTLKPGEAEEEHIFFRKRSAVGGTVSGLVRDITSLNGGTGRLHINTSPWESLQSAEYINAVVEAMQRGYIAESQAVLYVSATSFTVEGNQTAIYTNGRIIRIDEDDTKIAIVVSSSYSSGTGLTTAITRGVAVPNPLTSIEYAFFQPTGFTSTTPVYYAQDTAANDTYLAAISPGFSAYFAGMIVVLKAVTANTGACTLNVNSISAVSIKLPDGTDPEDNAIAAGGMAILIHDGTNFQLLNARPSLTTITLTEAPVANATATGIKEVLTAGESLAAGDVCYFKSDGKMWKADASVIATSEAIGIALATIAAEATGLFLLHGVMRLDAWAWTVGGLIFLSETTGALTQTAPTATDTVTQIMGVATHADRIFFKPELNYTTHT